MKNELDILSARLVEAGLADRAADADSGTLIVRGQARLLDDVSAMTDLEHVRALFAALETGEQSQRRMSEGPPEKGVRRSNFLDPGKRIA